MTSIGLPPRRYWAVGDQRMTLKGLPLEGSYRESYCVFEIGKRDDGEFANCLRDALEKLEDSATFTSHLRQTGGKVSFFISWSPGDQGEVFDVQLLADMARIGINLGVEPFS